MTSLNQAAPLDEVGVAVIITLQVQIYLSRSTRSVAEAMSILHASLVTGALCARREMISIAHDRVSVFFVRACQAGRVIG
jgi:hypothetical protein